MAPKRSGKRSAAEPTAAQASELLDYRAPVDDAWYAVRLRLEREGVLRVMYCNFSEVYDERFEPDRFGSLAEVEEFGGRFRPPSVQLQDWECRKVAEGMKVCAAHAFGKTDVRFYDAVVDSVSYKTHSLVEGKDLCPCTFVVLWQQGPLTGEKTSTGIENISLLQSIVSEMDPTLQHFLDMARKKLEPKNSEAGHFSESSRHELESTNCDIESSNIRVATCSSGKLGLLVDHNTKKTQISSCNLEVKRVISDECQEMKTPKMTADFKHTFRGQMHSCRKSGQDLDLGSSKKRNNPIESYFFFRIENLEKDLSQFCVMDFIREQTDISSQVFICPALSSESCSRGTILVDTKDKAVELSRFLFSPGHIIMSSRGRPWVISEKWRGSMEGVMPTYEKQTWNRNGEHSSNLKLVHVGTKEYEMGEQLLKMHKEFHDHAELLHERLVRDERELMQ